MIQGTEGFHFIGLTVREQCAMLVFQEGLLMLDQSLPGWGVMPHAELLQLFPDAAPAPASAARRIIAEDDDWLSRSDTDDTESSSDSDDAGASDRPVVVRGPNDPAGGVSDDEDENDDEPTWWLQAEWLGWWPAEGPLQVGRVTRQALAAHDTHPRQSPAHQALAADFRAGRLAPQAGSTHPEDGVMVELQQFGLPRLVAWRGPWMAAGEPALQQKGLTPAVLAAVVARSRVASHCNLADVQETEVSRYLGHVEDTEARVLVFDNGLLVLRHAEGQLEGWHPNWTACWGVVSPQTSDALVLNCSDNATPRTEQVGSAFRAGELREQDGTRFAALLELPGWARRTPMVVKAPQGLIAPGAPGALPEAEVHDALRQARLSMLHDGQLIGYPATLRSGAWQVPVVLGLVRLLTTVSQVPGLPGRSWHDTLQPLLERLLLAQRAQETAWLADGVIPMPIDTLIDLTQRDRRLRRSEVALWWPVALLADLIKALAPLCKTQVVALPRLEDVEKALSSKAGMLLVFTATQGGPKQSVVSVTYGEIMAGAERITPDELRARIRRTTEKSATERFPALVMIN